MLNAQRLDNLLLDADVWAVALGRLIAHAGAELAAERSEEARRSDWDQRNASDPFE